MSGVPDMVQRDPNNLSDHIKVGLQYWCGQVFYFLSDFMFVCLFVLSFLCCLFIFAFCWFPSILPFFHLFPVLSTFFVFVFALLISILPLFFSRFFPLYLAMTNLKHYFYTVLSFLCLSSIVFYFWKSDRSLRGWQKNRVRASIESCVKLFLFVLLLVFSSNEVFVSHVF